MENSARQLSFNDVRRELSQPLLRYLRRHVRDHAVADDILQETLVRIARGLDSFAGRANIRPWAVSIARRAAADHLREARRTPDTVELNEETQLPDPARSVDELAAVNEMNTCVREVIGNLPDEYRAALLLHDLEGLSVDETARKCGCSLPTAKIRIHRARRRLKTTLQRQCEFYRDNDDVFRRSERAQPIAEAPVSDAAFCAAIVNDG